MADIKNLADNELSEKSKEKISGGRISNSYYGDEDATPWHVIDDETAEVVGKFKTEREARAFANKEGYLNDKIEYWHIDEAKRIRNNPFDYLDCPNCPKG